MDEYIILRKGEPLKFANEKALKAYLLEFPDSLECEIYRVERVHPKIERKINI